ncbi:restriction endonuclease subunit S [Acinetobacter baumannii]|nr:restriction endonuclease subunit S [Acinetobacter baumannii]
MSQLELPKGWINCQFKDIVCVNPKVIANDEDLSGFIPMSHAPVNFFDSFKYDERIWGEIKKKYTNFADGDVIFAKVTPCFENGKAALLEGLPNGIGAGSSEFYVLRPLNSTILSKYVFSIIKSAEFLTNGERSMTGAVGLRRVPRSFVENFEVNLPPLAEQKVIADKLDTLLAQVESIKARLERIPEILKQLRQSVLAAAVSGRLTEEWREEESIAISEKVSNIFNVMSGVAFKKDQYSHEGSKLLQISNVGYGQVLWDVQNYVSLSLADEFKDFSLEENDIVLALNRPITNNLLKVAMVKKEDLPSTLYQRVARLRVKNPSKVSTKYAYLAMSTAEFRKQVEQNLKGSDQPYLNTSTLHDLVINIFPFEEQVEIIRRVEQFLELVIKAEQQIQSALERVNSLTQSILAKAFRGELTADWREANPELISGENSAEALLKRIKAECESAKPTTKRGRAKT